MRDLWRGTPQVQESEKKIKIFQKYKNYDLFGSPGQTGCKHNMRVKNIFLLIISTWYNIYHIFLEKTLINNASN